VLALSRTQVAFEQMSTSRHSGLQESNWGSRLRQSRIVAYLIGGAVILLNIVVIAAVLAGAVWLAVGLLR